MAVGHPGAAIRETLSGACGGMCSVGLTVRIVGRTAGYNAERSRMQIFPSRFIFFSITTIATNEGSRNN